MGKIDAYDMKLLDELVKDSSAPVTVLAKKVGANESFVYSRLRRLKALGLIKRHTITVDERKVGIGVKALVGISRKPGRKEDVHARLMAMPEVQFISEVIGRFDIMVGIIASDHEALHPILTNKIGKIDGVEGTETFVELQRIEKDVPFADLFAAGLTHPNLPAPVKKQRQSKPTGGRARGGGRA